MLLTGVMLTAWGIWMGGMAMKHQTHGSASPSPEGSASEISRTTTAGDVPARLLAATDQTKGGRAGKPAPGSQPRDHLIGNRQTGTYHIATCERIKKGIMSEKNRVELSSHEEAHLQGYHACKSCLPEWVQSSKSALGDGPKGSP